MEKAARIGATLAVLLLLVASNGCTLNGSPRRSLAELRTALVNHDAENALHYIDVDSIVEGMVRDILSEYQARSDDPMSALGVKAGRQVADAVMPAMKAVARRQVRAAILSDDQWGYFKEIRRSSVWYLDITIDGDTAVVKPKGKSEVSFKMTRTGEGLWRIVEILRKKWT